MKHKEFMTLFIAIRTLLLNILCLLSTCSQDEIILFIQERKGLLGSPTLPWWALRYL